jgi:uncharacterized protein YbaP (TraB family)
MPLNFVRPVAFLALAAAPALAVSGVYKCLDQNNKVFYQDKPCRELTSTSLSPALAQLAPEENRRRLFWKLTAGDRTVYVLGSLTYGAADMYPLPEAVMDAFGGTKVLAIATELDAGDALEKSPAVAAKGRYPEGTNLQAHLKPATWDQTLNLAKELKISEEALAGLKPWLAALVLKNAALRQAGFDDKLSVDKTFIKAAQTQKPVVEIDTLENQAALYDSLNDAEQEQVLLRGLREADGKTGYFKALADAWKKGDDDAIAKLLIDMNRGLPKLDKALERLFDNRNKAFADKVFEMAADGRPYFLVVDARHLGGDNGILSLLQDKGFTLTRL